MIHHKRSPLVIDLKDYNCQVHTYFRPTENGKRTKIK